MTVRRIHFWTGRIEGGKLRVTRCGARIREGDFGQMTTARGAVTCQRCRTFLAIDGQSGRERGRR